MMPTVETTLRTVSEWKYLISTDLRDAFYQIPLDKESMKWCATQTPYRGLRVYVVACQGLPGSSEWLEELLSLLLGSMIQEEWVALQKLLMIYMLVVILLNTYYTIGHRYLIFYTKMD